MTTTDDGRGILYPERLPTFHRQVPGNGLESLIRWFWIPRWALAEGQVSSQELLAFPASNLVVESGTLTYSGPTTVASRRELRGTGWAVGALLRPAAIGSLGLDPIAAQDTSVAFPAADLRDAVSHEMEGADDDLARSRAVAAFGCWAAENMTPPDAGGLLANAMEDLIASDRTLTHVHQVARQLGVSTRSVQRLARQYVGLPPLTIIRRYRLQEAAQKLRDDSSVGIAEVAAALGYADQAHLSTDFRRVLGLSPSAYRRKDAPADRRTGED